MTGREAIDAGAERLRRAGITNPRLEARLLLASALGLRPEAVLAQRDRVLDPTAYGQLVLRRTAREPLAHILGEREFWSLPFAVSPATLVPRPDSETLIEASLAAFPDRESVRMILDLGTGTGCLLLAALTEFPAAFGVGIDAVPLAAALARRNAGDLGLSARTSFVCANWGESLGGRFDLVLCNPPYVASAELPRLMPEVARYEPATALVGGPDGLDAYRSVLPQIGRLLAPGGVGVVEIAAGRAKAVAELANSAGLTTSLRADLAGTARAVILRSMPPQKNRLA